MQALTALIRPSIAAVPDSPIIEIWRLAPQRPDAIALWAGESDRPTPQFICDAATAALARGETHYSTMRGIPALRQAIADYHLRLSGQAIDDDRVAVTSSGMMAVMTVAQAIAGPGDNVVCITPSWPNVLRAVEVAGAAVRTVALAATPDGWTLDMDALFARCDARTKAIYFASPGNPTGWIMERAQQQQLLAFARRSGIAILADEVYQRIVYDRPHAPSMLDVSTPEDAVFVVQSFSKAWAMTGWRLGWMVYPAPFKPTVEKLIQFSISGGQQFLQQAGVVALREGEPFVRDVVERCRQARALVLAHLQAMPGVTVVPSQAAFYLMFRIEGEADALAFCKRALLDGGIGLSPGIAFSPEAQDHVRLCFAKSPALLEEAMRRLRALLP